MTLQSHTSGDESPFEMHDSIQSGATVLALHGACTMDHAEELGDKIMNIAQSPTLLLVLELSDLEFIESTNLGKLVAGYLHLRRRHGDLRIVAPQPRIRQLLELTRLSALFGVFDSIPDAVAHRPN